MATQIIKIKRTETPNTSPSGLAPGELAVEMAIPTRLWVGVPVSLDPSGKKLLIDLSTGSPGGGLTQDAADARYVNIGGDTMNGILNIDADQSAVRLDGVNGASLGFEQSNVPRWSLHGLTDLAIQRFDNAGASLGNVLTINRGTGLVSMMNGASITGTILVTGNATLGAAVTVSTTLSVGGMATLAGANSTGDIAINKATPRLYLNKTAGTQNLIHGQAAGVNHWIIEPGDGVAQSGGNAGSNFNIHCYADNGSHIATPFTITRANGQVTIASLNSTNLAATNLSGTTLTVYGASTLSGLTNNGALQNNGAINSSNAIIAQGDLKSASGVVRLNGAGDRYLYWDGTNYQLGGSGTIWHSGNFSPSGYLPLLGGQMTGILYPKVSVGAVSDANGGQAGLEVKNDGSGAAKIAFHRTSAFAAYFGLDTDNQWKVGGWSYGGASYRIWHEGNINPVPISGGVTMTGILYHGSGSYYFNTDGAVSASTIYSATHNNSGNSTINGTMQAGGVVTWNITNYGSLTNNGGATFGGNVRCYAEFRADQAGFFASSLGVGGRLTINGMDSISGNSWFSGMVEAAGHFKSAGINLGYPGVYFNDNQGIRINYNTGDGSFFFSHPPSAPKYRGNGVPDGGYIYGSKGFDDTTGLWGGFNAGNGLTSVIRASGGFESWINSYGGISDTRLKNDIEDPSPKLAKVMQVPVKTYTMKLPNFVNGKVDGFIESDMRMIGVPSDALAKIFPSLVERAEDGYDRVKYSVLNGPILLKAFQEYVTASDARMAELEAKLAQLIASQSKRR